MRYTDFERILSAERMARYLKSCGGDSRKAMTLYRYNLQLSQEMFTVISCFEVALRNAIDTNLTSHLGNDWLRDAVTEGGIFTDPMLSKTANIITHSYNKLQSQHQYTHSKLLSDMDFGIWKYMFSPLQYRLTGRTLLQIFPNKPRSTKSLQINQAYIFNELDKVNTLRNRIAHHEPVCFGLSGAIIDTTYIQNKYSQIQTLFAWMGIDSLALLYGLDHVRQVCDKIKCLCPTGTDSQCNDIHK